MNPETALQLTYLEAISDELTVSGRLRLAKEIFNSNNNTNTIFSLSDQDINFMEMFELLDLDQREKDIMYISQFYHTCYSDYNISIITMNQSISTVSINRLIKMYHTLKSHGLLKFLFADGKIVHIEEFHKIINR